MRYQIRPLGLWTDPETTQRRPTGVFRATWPETLELLETEIDKIGGEDPVVVQVDVAEADIRLDGMLRASAQVGHPGVIVSFGSDYGPLRYATDAYEKQWGGSKVLASWQGNVRAIALTLGSLRDIDRWGVPKRGQQYTGWKALPAAAGVTFPSVDEAVRWMRDWAGRHQIDEDLAAPRTLYRAMARRLHPDAGGDPDDWERLAAARLLLTTAGML
jgi:hypothetical protein